MNDEIYYNDELYHHGILGQKWGVRRYQNPDGSLTPAGRKRYLQATKSLKKTTTVDLAGVEIARQRAEKSGKSQKDIRFRDYNLAAQGGEHFIPTL